MLMQISPVSSRSEAPSEGSPAASCKVTKCAVECVEVTQSARKRIIMARTTPRVENALLVAAPSGADAVVVGSPAWYAWLEQSTMFAFVGLRGSFTARKERRGRGGWYWKAYRKHAGVVRSAYLGKSANLSLERLQTAAATLAELALPETAPTQFDADHAPSHRVSSVRAVAALPTGTLTFCFTDIEGSTHLWEQHPHAMPAALALHDTLLRHAIETHGGVVFKMVGDGVHAVFARASDAITAALAAQQALHAADWGDLRALRVRMAMHTGA